MLVSIIIPTYNRLEYLKKSLNSARTQTYKNIEIIVTDDASSIDTEKQDQFLQICKEEDSRIKYLKNFENTGFVANLNRGLSAAKGEIICILFDDDSYLPKHVENAVKVFNDNQDIAFVQVGAWNDFGTHKTPYWPRVCGKMHKFLYMSFLHPDMNDENILWSISPCNYVFRNKNIRFRETLYDSFLPRQLKRGSGYDVLFILDHLSDSEYCYHLEEHTCIFTSHDGSFSQEFHTEVVHDTKKGIYQYFKEKPNFIWCELYKYIYKNICFRSLNLEKYAQFFLNIIHTYDISIYEIQKIFYSHDRYILDIDKLLEIISFQEITEKDLKIYNSISTEFHNENKYLPTMGIVKYLLKQNISPKQFQLEKFINFLWNIKFQISTTIPRELYDKLLDTKQYDDIEKNIIQSPEYQSKWTASFGNIIKYYWPDFKKRNIRKIGLATISNHLRYMSMWKDDIFHRNDIPKSRYIDTWNYIFIHHLMRRYKDDEKKSHINKDATSFLKEIVKCPEFIKLNDLKSTDMTEENIEQYCDTKKKVWETFAIPISYNTAQKLCKHRESQWEKIIQEQLDFNSHYYEKYRVAYFYHLNEIIGEDLKIAVQISGHIRYYNDLAISMKEVSKYAECDTHIFVWKDGTGMRNKLYDNNNTENEIATINNLFSPSSLIIDCNESFIKTNVKFAGFTPLEINDCFYPRVKSQLYSIYQASKLREQYEQANDIVYDIVFKLRFDAKLGEIACTESLFHMYYTSNFKNFIFVSNDDVHGHPDGTGCKICNIAYWDYGQVFLQNHGHTNDICDFVNITSSKTMNHIANLYKEFERIYDENNSNLTEAIHLHLCRGKTTENNNFGHLPAYMNGLYNHFSFKVTNANELNTVSQMPFYPEGILKKYLQNFMVVSNRYFRITFTR